MTAIKDDKAFRFLRKALLSKFLNFQKQVSYAQCGEDLIVNFVAGALNLKPLAYLDIGTNHPQVINNTYFFYQKGCSGVCIEPDPDLYREIKKYRPWDTVLNAGIGAGDRTQAEFYRMTASSLSTFSRSEAERFSASGRQKIEEVVPMSLLKINDVIRSHFPQRPDFISIDTEGWDLEILKTLNFQKYRPAIFCIETLTYDENKKEQKLYNIIKFMQEKNYLVYADTYINTIFVDLVRWQDRK